MPFDRRPWRLQALGGAEPSGACHAAREGGFYEEDCAWAIVALTFPHLFTGFARSCAGRTIKDNWFEAWEAITGTILAPGESHEKDRRAFEAGHAGDWIVVSAITSEQQPGFVECVAAPGGHRGP